MIARDAGLVERVHHAAGVVAEGRAEFAHVGLGGVLEFAPLVVSADNLDGAGVEPVGDDGFLCADRIGHVVAVHVDDDAGDGPAELAFGLLAGIRARLLDLADDLDFAFECGVVQVGVDLGPVAHVDRRVAGVAGECAVHLLGDERRERSKQRGHRFEHGRGWRRPRLDSQSSSSHIRSRTTCT